MFSGSTNVPRRSPIFVSVRQVTLAPQSTQYTPPQVAAAYSFPKGLTGSGQSVAIIELGGGFREDDLSDYFSSLGITLPSVHAVSVLKGENRPGKPDGPDGEVMLDIEVLGSVAPGANISVYFAPNTDQGFIDAVTTAVHDTTRAALGDLHQLGQR